MIAETSMLAGTGALVLLGAASLASGVTQSVLSSQSSRRAARQAERASREAEAELQARGREEADLRRREGRRLIGQQRALAGASGLRRDSFFDLLVDTAMREEEAAQRVQDRFSLRGRDVRRSGGLEASRLRAQSRQTLLGGATNFLSSGTQLGVAFNDLPSGTQ